MNEKETPQSRIDGLQDVIKEKNLEIEDLRRDLHDARGSLEKEQNERMSLSRQLVFALDLVDAMRIK